MESDFLEELKEIIKHKKIRTVFQPIVSLENGDVLGFEALTRGPSGSDLENPQILFTTAKKNNMLFELEKICRENALCKAQGLDQRYKIFLNVDPHVIYDQNFRGGMTKNYLNKLLLKQENVVIELTEKTLIEKLDKFEEALSHYKNQGYKIAIDDTGTGYSGLQTIVSISYEYIKLDRSLIADVDKDMVKQSLLEAFIKFANKIDSKIIAEGVETLAELNTLIDLGVDYAQGFFIARPDFEFRTDFKDLKRIIKINNLKQAKNRKTIIDSITFNSVNEVVNPETKTDRIVERFEDNEDLQSIVVLDDMKRPQGLIMRDKLYSHLGTKFGYSIFMDRPIKLIMNDSPTIVKAETSINKVVRKAMKRKQSDIYDVIIVTKDDKYYGTVSIKDLLESFAKLQVEAAKHSNPLTKLPGNPAIEEEIIYRINNNKRFSVLYLDLDNFKPYNDKYGYKKGDQVITFTAQILEKSIFEFGNSDDFVGHIGGDDFVIITTPDKDQTIAEFIVDTFDARIIDFFEENARKRGFIKTEDRQGHLRKIPLTSISIAIVSNEKRKITNHLQVSDRAAEIKKYAKSQAGSLYVKDRRWISNCGFLAKKLKKLK